MRKYKAGKIDVLVASRTIGEGVDGLQLFGNRVIINAPPWHNSAWQQLLGRWHRKGQTRDVEVIVPIVILTTEGGHEISLDLDRLGRVNRTATLADCVLDGVIPTAQSQQSVLETARKQLEGMT
jgi:superfamily II DNA or RNA helicase